MPISKANGFTALIVPYPSSPDSIPRALPEYKVSQSGNLIEAYISAEPYLNFRIYFARCTEINDLECWLSVLEFEGTTICKAYAIGGDVVRNELDNPWHLSSQLSGSVDLVDLGKKVIELKLVRSVIREGVQLGNGELLVQNFKFIDDREFVLFRWFWCTAAQALELQLDPTVAYIATPATDNSITNFLSAKEKLLVSLLTPEQRIKFLFQLTTSPTTSIHLSIAQKEIIDETRKKLEIKLLESQSNTIQKSTSKSVTSDLKSNASPLTRSQSPTKLPIQSSTSTVPQLLGTENQNLHDKLGDAQASPANTSRSLYLRSPSPLKPGMFDSLLSSCNPLDRNDSVQDNREGAVGQIENRESSPDCMDNL